MAHHASASSPWDLLLLILGDAAALGAGDYSPWDLLLLSLKPALGAADTDAGRRVGGSAERSEPGLALKLGWVGLHIFHVGRIGLGWFVKYRDQFKPIKIEVG